MSNSEDNKPDNEKVDWTYLLYKQLYHIYHQYSDDWSGAQERQTEKLLNDYEKEMGKQHIRY